MSDDASAPEAGDDDFESDDEFLRAVAAVPEVQPPSAEPDRVGGMLGQFQITSVLGRGGMGIVYAADDSKLRRRVALKVLPASGANDPERRARFLREARAASAVSHPNIATVYDVGEADDDIFIAMEHVDGPTLRKRLESGALPVAEAVRIAVEIARGLGKAHAAGIVHRDLKPDNIMIGPDGLVKILDFGLAKPHRSQDGSLESTASALSTMEGRILGTPSYMSPEQAKGKPVDARSDVFSLGIVLYEMLSGQRPFAGDSTMEILIAVDRDAPQRLTSLRRDVPAALERVVSRCLEKSPNDRYQSADELAAALTQLPTRAPRRWTALVIGAIGLAAIAILIVRVLPQGEKSRAGGEPEASAASNAIPAPVAATASVRPFRRADAEVQAPVASAVEAQPAVRPRSRVPVPRSARPPPTRDPLAEQK